MTHTNNIPENIRKYFKKPVEIELFASTLGISKDEWKSVPVLQSKDYAKTAMRINRFDVMPIIDEDGKCDSYWITKDWGRYTDIRREYVNARRHTIPYRTPFKELVNYFCSKKMNYFFLNNGEEIVGLVTIANLNSDEVYLYLYSLLSKFERKLGKLLQNYKYNQVYPIIKKSKEIWKISRLKKYSIHRKAGIERYWWEYLSIDELALSLSKFEKYNELGYSSKKAFDTEFDLLIKVRHLVAHPSNNLIHGINSINNIYNFIRISEKILSKLNNEVES